MASYEAVDFRRVLRADRKTFWEIVSKVGPQMDKESASKRKCVKVDKRVAVALYHYAHGGTFFATGEKFGIATSTAHGIVFEFIEVVLAVYQDRLVFPTGAKLEQVIKGFESKRQLPNCCGAIDCSHVLIYTPAIETTKGYVDRAGKMSVILQAVVDSLGRFLDITAGWAGSVNDKRVFSNSPIGDMLRNKELLQSPVVDVKGINVLPYLVGDAGYTLEPFNMTPYPGVSLPRQRERFNFYQSSTRIIVEQAFGRLKGRFKWLNGVVYVRSPLDYPGKLHTAELGLGPFLQHQHSSTWLATGEESSPQVRLVTRWTEMVRASPPRTVG